MWRARVPRVSGGRSEKVFFGIAFDEQQIGIPVCFFLLSSDLLISFELADPLVAHLYHKLVEVGWGRYHASHLHSSWERW